MVGYRVGIVEDDVRMRDAVARGLRGQGLAVTIAVGTGGEFLAALTEPGPGGACPELDVAILDVGLPDCDGRDLCLALRGRGVDVPVLFLTARDAVADRLLGFGAGADDYLAKPFAFAELVARVTALGRRRVRAAAAEDALRAVAGAPEEGAQQDTGDPPTASGPVAAHMVPRLDPASHALLVPAPVGAGGPSRTVSVRLTPTEFRLLSVLMARPGEVVRRRALVAAGWADGSIVHDNTLDAYLARIRRKLRGAGAPVTITTVHGVGYQVEP